MRYLFICIVVIGFISCKATFQKDMVAFADNPVIAHRGAWKTNNLPENSIASLKRAIEFNCVGSEFDVRMTSDDVLIVTHDADYNNLVVEETTYAELSKHKLSNGETLPTLEQYLLVGMQNNTGTGLVCEIKPSKTEGQNLVIAEKVVKMVKALNAEPFILTYISFSYEILKKVKELDPNAKTQYLDGSKTPERLKEDGITGMDYLVYKYKIRPQWIDGAKEHGLILNAWVANTTEDMDWLLANDFDFITTDEPELLFERIAKSPTKQGYKLVWSDEFNYKGKPDNTKWAYDYGFISNQEKQYFTDSLKNARVENGHLIIEAHKEKIANKDYGNEELKKKSWLKYVAEIDTAQYTSARLKTDGLASWKYGRIEVKAKLPKGVGLWPAIWMLGENRKQVGWPESGEIDIMEHVGFNPDSIFGTIHTKAYNHMIGTERGKKIFIDKPYDTFHVFALEWTPEKMDFILDDVVYNQIENEHKTTAEWPFDQKFHLILNVSVGGMLGGQKGIDDSVFPQKMMIDYVRVFQKKE
ncbi:glycerophosphodiester phosphodiesterase family protein [Mariniflexile gromovii]|uniref:Family 16 glycosylhydrolase n=1 Tax=Mariniflexile gromovii TaxID=362523 RepID=A0ABS4BXT2_9FLAO|nr:family 16 glycosylhydrolase [Mariniflexile gromovii]MBP0905403.1 family 16 glycosylhydrolase [Mariniflexile gromovii]